MMTKIEKGMRKRKNRENTLSFLKYFLKYINDSNFLGDTSKRKEEFIDLRTITRDFGVKVLVWVSRSGSGYAQLVN